MNDFTQYKPMKVVLIARSTLFTSFGGDTIQIIQTAKELQDLGIHADIKLTTDKIGYENYDLLHFFNLTRPADILYHLKRSNKPVVLSAILIDYSECEKNNRNRVVGVLLRLLSPYQIEYMKTIARILKRTDRIGSAEYFWRGQLKSMKAVLKKTDLLLPASEKESSDIKKKFSVLCPVQPIPIGIDTKLFTKSYSNKNDLMILCVARIERVKNQLNLIKALNNTQFTLILVGAPSPNHLNYYRECKRTAAKNILFYDHLPQKDLIKFYQEAKVHVLPSWFENCGLSSLEAAAMGCNLVVTHNGYISDYIGDNAFYCDPASPSSIRNAVEEAAASSSNPLLQKKVIENYSWNHTGKRTAEAYRKLITL